MVAEPAVGATSPSSIRSVVVFPAPLGPRSPTTRPGASCTVRSSTATTSPKRLVRPSKAMTDMDRCPLVSGGIGDRCPPMATVRIGRRGVVGRARGSRSASGSSHEYCSRVMTRRTGPRYRRRRDQSSSAAGRARHSRGHRRRRRPRRHGARLGDPVRQPRRLAGRQPAIRTCSPRCSSWWSTRRSRCAAVPCGAALAIALVGGTIYAARQYPPMASPAVPLIVYMAATRLDARRSRLVLIVAAVASWVATTVAAGPTELGRRLDRRRQLAARPLRAHPAPARRRARTARRRPGATTRGAGRAGRRRGAAAHRPRAARRPRPHDERGRRASRHRPPRRRRPPRRGDRRAGRRGDDGPIGDATRCARSSPCCAPTTTRARRSHQPPASTTSPPSSPKWPKQASTSTCTSTASRGRCPPASASPPTASPKRR